MLADKIESAEESAASAFRIAMLAGSEAANKQDRLVSGSNIKTINHQSILGSGNIIVDTDKVEKYKTKDDLDANGSLAGGDIAAVVDALLVEKPFTECYQPTHSEIEANPYNKKFTKVDGFVLNPDFNPSLITSNYGSLSVMLYSDGKSKGYYKEYPSHLEIECDYNRQIFCWEYDGTSGSGHRLYDSSGFNASNIDRVNNILREGDFRFSYIEVTYRENVSDPGYTHYYSYNNTFPADATAMINNVVKMLFADTQNADVYVRSSEWVRLLKEGDVTGGGADITIDSELSDTSENAVQNKVVKAYVDEKMSNNSYAIVLASEGFYMNRYGKDGSSLGKVYIKPNVPTRVYATAFAPNGSTGRIKSIKLGHLDTQGATDMGFMFGSSDVWQDVEELDLSYLDTSSVTVMDNFAQLPKVTKLDVTSFNTSNVVNMSCMFRFCENLTDIDVSNFDTSKVRYFDSMFGECKSLKSLDLSNFNTSSATTMSHMFFNCGDLEYLNLSSFDTSNIENLSGINAMFFGCGSLKTLILGENFFRVAAPIEGDGLQYMNSVDFIGLTQWTDESVVTSLVTNSYDRIANGLPEINLSLSSQTMAVLTDEHKATIAAKGYILQ